MRHYSAATNHRAEPPCNSQASRPRERVCEGRSAGTLRVYACVYIYIYISSVQIGVAHPRKSPFRDWCTRRYYDCPFLPPLLSDFYSKSSHSLPEQETREISMSDTSCSVGFGNRRIGARTIRIEAVKIGDGNEQIRNVNSYTIPRCRDC